MGVDVFWVVLIGFVGRFLMFHCVLNVFGEILVLFLCVQDNLGT